MSEDGTAALHQARGKQQVQGVATELTHRGLLRLVPEQAAWAKAAG